MFKMDRANIHLLVVFTWIAQITTGASDWKELDGISSSVVKTHFVQLQDPHEMETETETNFPHAGEVNYISKGIVGRDTSDGNTEAALKVNKQDGNLHASAPTTTPSSEQTDSDEYSEEDTEKPLALALLGTNVRFSISAEDERYTKKKQQQIYDATDKENDSPSTSAPPITTTPTSKTTTKIISSTVKLRKPVPLVIITRSNQTGGTIDAKTTNPTSPTTVNPTTPIKITKLTVHTSSTTLKSTQQPTTTTVMDTPSTTTTQQPTTTTVMDTPSTTTTQQPTTTTVMDTPSTTAKQDRRATIRSRLARPKMIAHFRQKTAKILTTFATTQSRAEESSTIQLASFTESSSSSTSTPMPTPSQSEPSAVMTLLKDMPADYPLDMAPDIETFYDDKERKQSPSPAMSASTTNTIVISSIIGGCAILFFALMMVFYMWKQRKVRRRRKRPIPKLSLGKPNHNWHFGQTYENG